MPQFSRFLSLSLILALGFGGPASASDLSAQHACDMAQPSDIAQALGLDPSAVSEQEFYQSRSGRTTTCQWEFRYANGMQGMVHIRKEEKSPKVTNPNFYVNNMQHLLETGRKLGSKTIQYAKHEIAGIETGAVSDVHGNRFTKQIDFVWHQAEDRRLEVNLIRTMADDGTLIEPTAKDLEPLVHLAN